MTGKEKQKTLNEMSAAELSAEIKRYLSDPAAAEEYLEDDPRGAAVMRTSPGKLSSDDTRFLESEINRVLREMNS